MLDDLREAAAEFTIGERSQQLGIGEHQRRRIEGSDKVLPFRKIDSGLAADRAVNLGDERRRDVHKFQPAQEGGSRKAGYVTDYASTNRHQQ